MTDLKIRNFRATTVAVVMRAHNIRKPEISQFTVTSTEFVIHENWNPYLVQKDIALIKLPQPVQFNGNFDNTNNLDIDSKTF